MKYLLISIGVAFGFLGFSCSRQIAPALSENDARLVQVAVSNDEADEKVHARNLAVILTRLKSQYAERMARRDSVHVSSARAYSDSLVIEAEPLTVWINQAGMDHPLFSPASDLRSAILGEVRSLRTPYYGIQEIPVKEGISRIAKRAEDLFEIAANY